MKRWFETIYNNTMSETTVNEERLLEVKAKIEKLLTEYGAALVPITLISGEKVLSRVDIVSLKKEDVKSE